MKALEEKVRAILAGAERELREAIAGAAMAGDLGAVDLARMAAGRVREIIEAAHGGRGSWQRRSRGSGTAGRETVHGRRKRGVRRSPYPKFIMRNDSLYRVGWSKKRRGEYHHKVPRHVFDGTVEAIAGLSAVGAGPFTAEEIMERANAGACEPFPAYQVYVVIGFLRARRCVEQLGREGYQAPADFSERAARAWAEVVRGSVSDVAEDGSEKRPIRGVRPWSAALGSGAGRR